MFGILVESEFVIKACGASLLILVGSVLLYFGSMYWFMIHFSELD